MAKSPSLRWDVLTLKANGGEIRRDFSGSVFICKESTDQFQVSIDSGRAIPMEAGLGFRTSAGTFSSLLFTNLTASDVTIEYYVGDSQVIDARLNTIVARLQIVQSISTNADTYPKGQDPIALASGATNAYNGLDGTKKRKQIIVTNLDAAALIKVKDGNGKIMGTVFPLQAVTFESGGTVKVYNPNGGAVNIEVGEIFYS